MSRFLERAKQGSEGSNPGTRTNPCNEVGRDGPIVPEGKYRELTADERRELRRLAKMVRF